jgi:hypothetical protein
MDSYTQLLQLTIYIGCNEVHNHPIMESHPIFLNASTILLGCCILCVISLIHCVVAPLVSIQLLEAQCHEFGCNRKAKAGLAMWMCP